MAATPIPAADEAIITAAINNLRQCYRPAELLFLSLLSLETKEKLFGRLIITWKIGELDEIEASQTYKTKNVKDYLQNLLQSSSK
jgi:hypothetical protein